MAERAVPILPSRDLRETLAFYERLGFENRGAPPEEWDYLIIGRGSIELHFYGAPDTDPLTTAASCFVFVDDADALHDEWQQAGVAHDAATGSRLRIWGRGYGDRAAERECVCDERSNPVRPRPSRAARQSR